MDSENGISVCAGYGDFGLGIGGRQAVEHAAWAALMIAGEVAAEEARKRGKTYLVASAPPPSPAIYGFACDHPDAGESPPTRCSHSRPPASPSATVRRQDIDR
jgi:hypothetical protein